MHTKQCSTESNCGYGNLLRIELETSRVGRQNKKHTRPSGEATQRICREARLRPDSGACRFGYQGRGPRVRRSEARGAPAPLRSAASAAERAKSSRPQVSYARITRPESGWRKREKVLYRTSANFPALARACSQLSSSRASQRHVKSRRAARNGSMKSNTTATACRRGSTG